MRILLSLVFAAAVLAPNGAAQAEAAKVDKLLEAARHMELVSADRGIEAARMAIALAERLDAPSLQARAHTALGRQQIWTADFAAAEQNLKTALTISATVADEAVHSRARLADANRLIRQGYLIAGRNRLQGVAEQLPQDDARHRAEALLLRAMLLGFDGQVPDAIEGFLQVAELANTHDLPRIRVRALANLGLIAARQGRDSAAFATAEDYAAQAQRLIDRHELAGLHAEVLRLSGYSALLRDEREQAEAIYLAARTAAETFGDRLEVAAATHGIGHVHNYRNEFAQAEQNLQQSIAINRELDAPLNLAVSAVGLASVWSRPADLGQADYDDTRARRIRDLLDPIRIQVTEEIASPRLTVYWQRGLSRALARLGAHERAHELSWSAADTERWLARNEATATLALHLEADERAAEQARIEGERAAETRRREDAVQVRNLSILAAAVLGIMSLVLCVLFRSLRRTHAQVSDQKARLQTINSDLHAALAQVRQLSGLIPMCARCKAVRDDEGYWKQIEAYICEHSDAMCSHGICPSCASDLYPDMPLPEGAPSPAVDP